MSRHCDKDCLHYVSSFYLKAWKLYMKRPYDLDNYSLFFFVVVLVFLFTFYGVSKIFVLVSVSPSTGNYKDFVNAFPKGYEQYVQQLQYSGYNPIISVLVLPASSIIQPGRARHNAGLRRPPPVPPTSRGFWSSNPKGDPPHGCGDLKP